MSYTTLLLPVFLQVALTFFLLFRSGLMRRSAVMRGQVKMKDIALGQMAWPEDVQKASNAFANQMQVPVLFYLLVVLTMIARQADTVLLILSWIFVLSRVVHAWIHCTSNYVPRRFYAFLAGLITLVVMWLWFAAKILLGGV